MRTPTRPRVLLAYPLPDSGVEAELRQVADVAVATTADLTGLAGGLVDADAVILRGPAQLTAELIDGAGRLRVIGAQGSGTDNIDVAAATRRRIPVVHGAGVAARAVAEYAVAAMVLVRRGGPLLHRRVAEGDVDWDARVTELAGREVSGTTLGVIGCGHIGRDVARIAHAGFGMDVIGYDPYLPTGADIEPIRRYDDLHALLRDADTVTLHLPLSLTSRGLLGRKELRLIGPHGVLVDAARGGIVDEDALVEVLEAGELSGAALDVFDPEPPSPERMRRLGRVPNLLLSPHVAGVTHESLARLTRNVVDGVLAVLAGRRPRQVVNPEVFAPAQPARR